MANGHPEGAPTLNAKLSPEAKLRQDGLFLFYAKLALEAGAVRDPEEYVALYTAFMTDSDAFVAAREKALEPGVAENIETLVDAYVAEMSSDIPLES